MQVHLETFLAASPAQVYAALTSAPEFSSATGRPASFDAREGGAFSLFDGRVIGRNVELEAGERIVQAWRFPEWAPGVYSAVRLELRQENEGTRVLLDQDAIPEGASPMFPTWREHVAVGWPMFYFEPLKCYFAK